MSFFNCNITGAGGSGGGAAGLATKFVKTVAIGSEETAEVQINLKNDISNYADITNEQIIADIMNVSASEAGTANLTQNYDAESGVLTITSDSSKIPFVINSTVEVIVYVVGAVQLPPVPESVLYDLGQGTTFYIATRIPEVDYTKLTQDNFIVEALGVNSGSAPYELQSDWDSVNLGAHARLHISACSVTKNYDAINGVLTVGGTDFTSQVTSESGTKTQASSSIRFQVYLNVGGKIIV